MFSPDEAHRLQFSPRIPGEILHFSQGPVILHRLNAAIPLTKECRRTAAHHEVPAMTDGQTTPPKSAGEKDKKNLSTVSLNVTDQTIIEGAEDVTSSESEFNGAQLQEGDVLGKYEVRKLLGTGAMGAVYLGFDPMIQRDVAIKVLSPEVAKNPLALDRFLTEARSTGRLSHPNVVSIFDIDQRDGQYYIVMEVLGGGSLADRSEDGQGIAWQEACRMVAEAADGMAAAHEAGLIHRDIKPENLMATEDGTVKIVDFGLSKLSDAANDTRDAATKAGTILGTPQYMSPEQCETAAVDFRSDIYSLGGTLFRLLTGRHPYQDSPSVLQVMMAHASKPIPDPLKYVPEVPEGCRDIINKAMAKSPDDRYHDAATMAKDLRNLVTGISEPASPVNVASPTLRKAATALIVEPSNMQAMMLSKRFSAAGLKDVKVCGTHAAAKKHLSQHDVPDIFITAMQLADGQGKDLLALARVNDSAGQTMLILNSSDSRQDALSESIAPCGLVSKRSKPDEVIRMIHAASWFDFESLPSPAAINPLELRLLIVCDTPQLPAQFLQLIREAGILDVRISTFDEDDLSEVSGADVVLTVRSSPTTAEGHLTDAHRLNDRLHPAAAAGVNIVAGEMILRTVQRGDMTFMTSCPFDNDRLDRIMKAAHR